MWMLVVLTWLLGICSIVSSCPHHCQCYLEDGGLRTANCSGSALTTLQQPSQIDVLNVRPHYNGFRTRLSSRGFKNFSNIKYLNLSNTSITIIPDEVFYGLNYIISIDLSYNKIKHLNGGVFKQLSTLQSLMLRGNPLMFIQSDYIVSTSLRTLDLGSCGLRNIPTGFFAHVPYLAILFLDGNFIQTLDRHSIPSSVSYLNLANNNIINVPTDILHKMKSLTRIDLSRNPIRCTCQLLLLQDAFSGQGRIFENDITCSGPRQFYGQKLSLINENDLCNLEFIKKERFMNSIKHFRDRDVRPYRKHNMIKPLPTDDSYDIQGDQPQISDELAPNHDSEVMFSNDDTRSMGTHMALHSFTSHYTPSSPLDISDENNKLSDSKQNLPSTDTDLSSTEVEVVSSEEEAPEELVAMTDEENNDDIMNIVETGHNHTEKRSFTDHEDIINESSPQMDQQHSSTEKTDNTDLENDDTMKSTVSEDAVELAKEDHIETSTKSHTEHPEDLTSIHESENAAELTEEDHIDTSSTTNHTEHPEDLTSIHESENAAELTEEDHIDTSSTTNHTEHPEDLTSIHETISEGNTEASIIHDTEELSSLSPLDTISSDSDNTNTTHDIEAPSSLDDDVEELSSGTHNITSEPLSRYSNTEDYNKTNEYDETSISSVDDIFKHESVTTLSPMIDPYTWPSSPSDLTDYSYDTQHDDYSSVDPNNVTDDRHHILTTQVYTVEDKSTTEQSMSSKFIELEEGSGFSSNETEEDSDTATALWMEEQENETTTEDYSVENVSNVFNVSSSDEDKLSHYSAEDVSTTEITPLDESTTSVSEISSSSTEKESEELSTTEEESTTEEIHTTMETIIDETSPESTVSSSTDTETETVTSSEDEETTTVSEESTTEALTVPEGIVEVSSTESSTAADISSSSISSIPIEVSSESSSAEVTTESHIESSTDSTTVLIPLPEEEEKVSDEVSSTSAPITSEIPVETESTSESSAILVHSVPETVSSTPVTEVEVVSKSVYVDDKENMILDPTKEERKEKDGEPDLALIGTVAAIAILILIIILISMAVVCRRTKRTKNKIRLPADPEANLGTEMQDMLLPKPPENGVKVVPKNYTNGTTASPTVNGNKPEPKEEEIPVLAAEPDAPVQEEPTDWEDKPEPIETVTARLTMLARPQTPVFIPKTLN